MTASGLSAGQLNSHQPPQPKGTAMTTTEHTDHYEDEMGTAQLTAKFEIPGQRVVLFDGDQPWRTAGVDVHGAIHLYRESRNNTVVERAQVYPERLTAVTESSAPWVQRCAVCGAPKNAVQHFAKTLLGHQFQRMVPVESTITCLTGCDCGAFQWVHPHTIQCALSRDPADDRPIDPVAGEGTDAERGTWSEHNQRSAREGADDELARRLTNVIDLCRWASHGEPDGMVRTSVLMAIAQGAELDRSEMT